MTILFRFLGHVKRWQQTEEGSFIGGNATTLLAQHEEKFLIVFFQADYAFAR